MKVLRSFLKRLSFDLFMLGDRLGVHLLPKHYHTPIPDYRWLRQHRTLWAGRASLTGVHWDLDEHPPWLPSPSPPFCHDVLEQHVQPHVDISGVGARLRAI